MDEKRTIQRGYHCVWQTHYHIVFPVKYRKILLVDQVVDIIRETSQGISERYSIEMEGLGMIEITSIEIFRRVPAVKRTLWEGEFWSDGYYAGTVGERGFEQVGAFHGPLPPISRIAKAGPRIVGDVSLREQPRQGRGIFTRPAPLALDQKASQARVGGKTQHVPSRLGQPFARINGAQSLEQSDRGLQRSRPLCFRTTRIDLRRVRPCRPEWRTASLRSSRATSGNSNGRRDLQDRA